MRIRRIAQLASGAVVLGLFQATGAIDFNNILVNFLARLLSLIVALLFGADSSQLLGSSSTTGA
ncbi:MAG: hypothetical protein U1D55_13405 [Phycisphaerae bacterium]